MYLAQKLTRGLGSPHVDHRLTQTDFRGDAADPVLPWLGQTLASLEQNAATLLVGSNVRKDQPLVGLRLRKSTLRGGAVGVLNPVDFDVTFDLAARCVVRPSGMLGALAAVARALGATPSGALGQVVAAAAPDAAQTALAAMLRRDGRKAVLLGPLALAHPDFSLLRELAAAIATACGATLGFLPEGANSTGAVLAGALPHRQPGGAAAAQAGEGAAAMLAAPRPAVLLLGVEPDQDLADPARAIQSLRGSATVVALSAFRSKALEDCADILLPVAAFAETSGTYVNVQGDRQGFAGAVPPPGEARPAWKVLRVLGNLTGLAGFEQDSSEQVRAEVLAQCQALQPDNALAGSVGAAPVLAAAAAERIGDRPLYAVDALVRRAAPLQATRDAAELGAGLAPGLARALGVADGDRVAIRQNGTAGEFVVRVDPRVAEPCVRLPVAVPGAERLGPAFGELSVTKV
jgi:NADH-quinone oxidoreductase subunit G